MKLLRRAFITMRLYKNVEAEKEARFHAFCLHRELQRKRIAMKYLVSKLNKSMQSSKTVIVSEQARDQAMKIHCLARILQYYRDAFA